MKRRNAPAILAVAVVALAAFAGPAAAGNSWNDTRSAKAESAVTLHGAGRFSNLAVTLDQTTHLRNQVVRVSWKGFSQTSDTTGRFYTNYLQIMQCWGDEAAPVREKCQFGGLYTDQRGGPQSTDRQVTQAGIVDPEETYLPEPGSVTPARVPFEAVNGKVVTERRNEFYDAYSTNEIPFGRTSKDGNGQEFFEIQTAREAPGLGCAADEGGSPRKCWLVVVPRDDIEVDGAVVPRDGFNGLVSSPLSASNWDDKIAFRLNFEPLGVTCPIGASEKRLLGHEMATEAITRWQPALCGETGSIFGFSQLGDDAARSQVLTDTPWMSIVNRAIPPDRDVDNRELTYAPLSVSGLGIAFNIDSKAKLDAPEAAQQFNGARISGLKLNARLVAKLLTQSYQRASLAGPELLAGNPTTLTDDPEFKKLNPGFSDLQYFDIYSLTNPLGLSDANRLLWEWIGDDPAAKAFVNGKADPWGMKVNKYYKAMSLDRSDFPRSDPSCQKFTDGRADLCPLDFAAYANDFHDAGRSEARGQTLSRATWDETSALPSWKANPPQASGERRVLAVVDTATAARYQLPMAQLLNGSGAYVAPTVKTMTAAIAPMKDASVRGVLEPAPGNKVKGAYPLTQVSYAVTAPKFVTTDERKAYSKFVEFAVTKGQKPGIGPGTLPEGYAPLPKSLQQQSMAAAAVIAKGGSPTSPESPGSNPDGDQTPGGSDNDGNPSDTSQDPSNSPGSTTPDAAGGKPPLDAPDTDDIETVSMTTPSSPVGPWRYVLLAALVVGVIAALARPLTSLVMQVRDRGRT